MHHDLYLSENKEKLRPIQNPMSYDSIDNEFSCKLHTGGKIYSMAPHFKRLVVR